MLRLIITTLLCLHTSLVAAYPANAEYWSHRSVLYFAPSNDEHVQQLLMEALINECQLSDRDVVTIVVTADGFTIPGWVKEEFNIPALFRAYGANEKEHTAVLIGKDGNEKLRWGKKTNWKEVSQTIDAMPMRKREMKTRSSPCSA